MFNVITRIPFYYLFRKFGWPPKLPMNLTLSVSFKCNSMCKTCNIYKKVSNELSLEEWKRAFHGLGKAPFWVTISGGEPFIRKDLGELVYVLYDKCKPSVINIPTNGLLKDRIPDLVYQIALHCRKSQIVINISIDDIGERHDHIRGVPGSYERAVDTFNGLKRLDLKNLTVGIHTVISRFNVKRIPEIYKHMRDLKPDSYITEIAEERVELGTIGEKITPEYDDYVKAVDYLLNQLKKDKFNKLGRFTWAFRFYYYDLVKKVIKENRQMIPCYAGFASAQIAPNGDVWNCCIKAEPIGNLKEFNYDFKKIWFSEKEKVLRIKLKNEDCYCPLANVSYTNMIFDLKSLIRVGWNYISLI